LKRAQAKTRLTKIYEEHNPDKLKDEGFLEKTLKKYAGNYDTLFARLAAKYGLKNPKETTCSEEADDDTRREYDDNYEKLKVAALKSKCQELGIELTGIPIAGKQKNPIKADIIAALRAKAAASD
jgi:hypothetical protein